MQPKERFVSSLNKNWNKKRPQEEAINAAKGAFCIKFEQEWSRKPRQEEPMQPREHFTSKLNKNKKPPQEEPRQPRKNFASKLIKN